MNQCSACGIANRDSARFCADCGNPISLAPETASDLAGLLQAEIDPIREKLAEKYQILHFIGRGGFSTVFLLKDRALERLCALKILSREQTIHAESVERFKREARLYASLDHPHIVSVYDFGFYNHVAYIIFKYIDGVTLREYVQRGHPLAQGEILAIAADLADILDYMHRRDVVHRDVKPDNVMIQNGDRKVILTDFGLAKKLDTTTVTSDGRVMGSPHYFSPEQAKGEPVDARSDIYSLGISIFEMASGIVPFKGDTPYEVILKHIREPLPDLSKLRPDLHPDLHKLIRKCTEKAPSQRFQTAAELKAALKRIPAPLPDMKTEIIRHGGRGRQSRSRRLWLVAALAAVAAFTIIGSYWARSRGIWMPAKWLKPRPVAMKDFARSHEPLPGQVALGSTAKGDREKTGNEEASLPAKDREAAEETSPRAIVSLVPGGGKHAEPLEGGGRLTGKSQAGLRKSAAIPMGGQTPEKKRGEAEKPEVANEPQGKKFEEKKGVSLPAVQSKNEEKPRPVETVKIMDLPAARVQEYIEELALVSAGPLAGEFKASGAIVLVLRVDETGHVGLEAMNDADVRVEPAVRRQEILELIRSRIGGIRIQPPVSKAGNVVRVTSWRVSLRIGRDRQMVILWRGD